MKAAIYDQHGPAAQVLGGSWTSSGQPPGPGEVRVKVHVSGVNPTDHKSRSGATPRPIDGFQVPHQDGAGVIDAVGPGVDQGPGRCSGCGSGWPRPGAAGGPAAEWAVVPERQGRCPCRTVSSFELGASLGVPAMTAQHRCLFADGPVAGQAGARRRWCRGGRRISPSSSPPGAGPPRHSRRPAARPRRSWPGMRSQANVCQLPRSCRGRPDPAGQQATSVVLAA